MIVEVTQKHIDDGRNKNLIIHNMISISCPVARAMNDALPNRICQISGGGATLWDINFDVGIGGYKTVLLPREVEDWITSFDRMYPVEPFSFEIDV